ncbi:MAG: hypothetical protein NVV73_15185 [Cellvibrionaceae bacterium]|nr:hypothetical protein [Cellvibrionaceae bacterium]
MKKMVLCFVLCAVAPVWAQQGNSTQLMALEKKLTAIEIETESMRVGKEELLAELKLMDPAVKSQTCTALNLSVDAIKTEISQLQKEIEDLEQPSHYAQLDEQQKARLVEQKMFLSGHNPSIDCPNL